MGGELKEAKGLVAAAFEAGGAGGGACQDVCPGGFVRAEKEGV